MALINQLGIFVESFTNNVEDSNSISPVLYIDYHPDNTIISLAPIGMPNFSLFTSSNFLACFKASSKFTKVQA